jgi:ABC-type glycerol-3-phosphate transport system substrate-binding protein
MTALIRRGWLALLLCAALAACSQGEGTSSTSASDSPNSPSVMLTASATNVAAGGSATLT